MSTWIRLRVWDPAKMRFKATSRVASSGTQVGSLLLVLVYFYIDVVLVLCHCVCLFVGL